MSAAVKYITLHHVMLCYVLMYCVSVCVAFQVCLFVRHVCVFTLCHLSLFFSLKHLFFLLDIKIIIHFHRVATHL